MEEEAGTEHEGQVELNEEEEEGKKRKERGLRTKMVVHGETQEESVLSIEGNQTEGYDDECGGSDQDKRSEVKGLSQEENETHFYLPRIIQEQNKYRV